jgi:hypothetical protein
MAATAMTTNSNVASIGEMAFLDLNELYAKFFTFLLFNDVPIFLFNLYEL